MKIQVVATIIVALGILTGCAGDRGLINAMSTSIRQDVFQDFHGTRHIPPGFASLRVVSSLKTHLPGTYSDKDLHGTPEYQLLVNIDGQAEHLTASLREERRGQPALRDSEEGHGIRYLFQKQYLLKSGIHRVFVSLPFDGAAVEREIYLADGSSNTLVLEPVYSLARDKRRIGFYTKTSFKEGIKGLTAKINEGDL